MQKQAQGEVFWIIIGAALAIAVLIIGYNLLFSTSGKLWRAASSCLDKGGICEDNVKTCNDKGGTQSFIAECPLKEKVCCMTQGI